LNREIRGEESKVQIPTEFMSTIAIFIKHIIDRSYLIKNAIYSSSININNIM
jgi:hypothetical protein